MNAVLESIDFQDGDVSLHDGFLLIQQSSRACLSHKGLLSDHHIPYVLSCISLASSRKHDPNTTLKVPLSPEFNLLIRQTEKFIIVVCTPTSTSSTTNSTTVTTVTGIQTSSTQQNVQPQRIIGAAQPSSSSSSSDDLTAASATPRASYAQAATLGL